MSALGLVIIFFVLSEIFLNGPFFGGGGGTKYQKYLLKGTENLESQRGGDAPVVASQTLSMLKITKLFFYCVFKSKSAKSKSNLKVFTTFV